MISPGELSTEFDVLYNNITNNQAPGLNEYEKSVFLTRAQSQLIQEYFAPSTDISDGGYDNTTRRQYSFSNLTKWVHLQPVIVDDLFDTRAVQYSLPDDWFMTLNEKLTVKDTEKKLEEIFNVVPISYDEYEAYMDKPFKYPAKNQAWRLIVNKGRSSKIIPSEDQHTIQINLGALVVTLNNYNLESTKKCIFLIIDPKEHKQELIFEHGHELYINLFVLATTGDLNTYYRTYFFSNPDSAWYNIEAFFDFYDWQGNQYPSASQIQDMIVDKDGKTTIYDFIQKEGKIEICFEVKEGSLVISDTGSVIELIGRIKGTSFQSENVTIDYRMRYVRTPKPIILEDLSDYDVSIQGETSQSTLEELPDEFYKDVLERAVTLAKIAWNGGSMTLTSLATNQQQNK